MHWDEFWCFERKRHDLPPPSLLLICLKQPGLGQTKAWSQKLNISHVGGRNPNIRAVACCLPGSALAEARIRGRAGTQTQALSIITTVPAVYPERLSVQHRTLSPRRSGGSLRATEMSGYSSVFSSINRSTTNKKGDSLVLASVR